MSNVYLYGLIFIKFHYTLLLLVIIVIAFEILILEHEIPFTQAVKSVGVNGIVLNF